jgi:hypothetical protein
MNKPVKPEQLELSSKDDPVTKEVMGRANTILAQAANPDEFGRLTIV